MENKRDFTIGLGLVLGIIAVVVVVVMAVLPEEPETVQNEPIEPGNVKPENSQQLSEEEIQKIVAGFEKYNESVQFLLDACADVESKEDFIAVGLLIKEHGGDFLETTAGYGAIKNKLIEEGYGDHSVLGPLMNRSVFLTELMSECMAVLAWEFDPRN